MCVEWEGGGGAREERDRGEWLTPVCVLQSCLALKKKNSFKKVLEAPPPPPPPPPTQ